MANKRADAKSTAIMKFLAGVARAEGVASHVYIVGGAVRNHLLGVPVKDVDVVVDSVALNGRDSDWFARVLAENIPTTTNLTTNQYGVAILTVKGDWVLDGIPLAGEVIEIANARKESYDNAGGKGKGYKPTDVSPATIKEDIFRREFTFNCMTGDTLVPTEKGILRLDKIASRTEGDRQSIRLQIAGKDGPAVAVGWQYSGFTDTLLVKTALGHQFSCTHRHPVLVLRGHDHVWVRADELSRGDLLCCPVKQIVRETPLEFRLPEPNPIAKGRLKVVSKPDTMTPELAFVLGCLVAEGSNTPKRVSFSNGDLDLIARYSSCFQTVFGVQPSRNRIVQRGANRILNGVPFVANRDCFDTYVDSKTIVGWLSYLGLYCSGSKDGHTASHYKVIPWSILEADAESQWAFLAAYLEGDGSIRPKSGRMVFRSVSHQLRLQIQILLGAHGILSKIDGEFVHVNAVDASLLWGKIQPWMVTKGFDYKGAKFKSRNRYGIPVAFLRGFLAGRKKSSHGRNGIAYGTDDGAGFVRTKLGDIPWSSERFLYDSYNRGGYTKFLESLGQISPTEQGKLFTLLDLGYQYNQVVSIQDAGKQDVYDLSMGEGMEPAFVANGLVVHNTLLWRLEDLVHGPERAEVLDLTGLGVGHLRDKEIHTPLDPDRTFRDDPTRMLRILKFLLRYDLKISPDVVAATKRNAHRLADMPWEAVATILVRDILGSPKARRGLKIMSDLGLTQALVDMVKKQPPFAAYLTRQLANGNHGVDLLLDLTDLGLDSRVLGFLTGGQKEAFRRLVAEMDPVRARKFLDTLRQPPIDSLALIEEFDLQGRDRGVLVPTAREVLLDDPDKMDDPAEITQGVSSLLRRGYIPKTADLSPPLGGGPCRVVERAEHEIRNRTLLEEVIADIEEGVSLPNDVARKIYHYQKEKGSFFKEFALTPHAQYRMDQRSIQVKHIGFALDSFAKRMKEIAAKDKARYEYELSQPKIAWHDQRLGLVIAFSMDSHDTLSIITTYWKGRADPPPQECSAPRVARWARG